MSRLTVLSGPSGVGKRTVITALRRTHPEIWVSVSCTTRSPRRGEVEGIDYYFVDHDRFAKMVDAGDLLEHAEFAGNRYGTPRQAVLDHIADGVPTILEIELAGARQVRRSMPEARFVFLAPPSIEALVQRLQRRGAGRGPGGCGGGGGGRPGPPPPASSTPRRSWPPRTSSTRSWSTTTWSRRRTSSPR